MRRTALLSSALSLALVVAGCAAANSQPDMQRIHLDSGTHSDLRMGAMQDLAMAGGSDAQMGNCMQVATWDTTAAIGGYDAMNMVSLVAAPDGQNPPFNALTIQDWQTQGEMYPKMATITTADKYASCELCTLIQACDMNGCQPKWFAQGGTVTVTHDDRNAQTGRMTATASNLTLVEWDFTQMGDKPVPNGTCFQVGSASFDVMWNNPADGGVPADMASPPNADLAMTGGDGGGGGCAPKVNEVQTAGATASDEWVEIFNPCSSTIDLTGWKLVYRSASNNSGGNDSVLYTFAQTIGTGQNAYLLIAGSGYTGTATADATFSSGGLSGNGGAVGLKNTAGQIVDSVAYQTLTTANNLTEGSPAPNPPASQSIARLPTNGNDSNNNSVDFQVDTTPTPKAPNK